MTIENTTSPRNRDPSETSEMDAMGDKQLEEDTSSNGKSNKDDAIVSQPHSAADAASLEEEEIGGDIVRPAKSDVVVMDPSSHLRLRATMDGIAFGPNVDNDFQLLFRQAAVDARLPRDEIIDMVDDAPPAAPIDMVDDAPPAAPIDMVDDAPPAAPIDMVGDAPPAAPIDRDDQLAADPTDAFPRAAAASVVAFADSVPDPLLPAEPTALRCPYRVLRRDLSTASATEAAAAATALFPSFPPIPLRRKLAVQMDLQLQLVLRQRSQEAERGEEKMKKTSWWKFWKKEEAVGNEVEMEAMGHERVMVDKAKQFFATLKQLDEDNQKKLKEKQPKSEELRQKIHERRMEQREVVEAAKKAEKEQQQREESERRRLAKDVVENEEGTARGAQSAALQQRRVEDDGGFSEVQL